MITPQDISARTLEVCSMSPMIPVLVVHDVAVAKPLAEALIAGGLPVLEVTLRTECALDVIKAMSEVPGGVVGAGTVLTEADAAAAKAAGAQFAVSPGTTDTLCKVCEAAELPLLPGAVTASEVMGLLERGYTTAKFFPAETSGGSAAIKALHGPLPQMTFCPTGGIGQNNAAEYLSLPNIRCVGGSWVTPADAIEAGDWARIEELAKKAAALRG